MTRRRLAELALQRFWRSRLAAVHDQWQRYVPFGDYVADRWERAATYGFGERSSVYDSCLVIGDVRVGEDCWIGPFTVLDGSGGLSVGARTTISAGVQLYTHDSIGRTLSRGETGITRRPTSVGDDCYIGPNVVVAMGVTIGDGAVVGANSLVLDDIPAGAKAYGNPCRVQA
jgi:acetyltransferase-like isoleucine patch superfamily enzyme